jgi:hypothetical protein
MQAKEGQQSLANNGVQVSMALNLYISLSTMGFGFIYLQFWLLRQEKHISWGQGCNGQLNPVHILTCYFYKINFNIILQSMPKYPMCSPPFKFSN